MLCGGEGSTGLTLHGGTARNPFGTNSYQYANGQLSCGMISHRRSSHFRAAADSTGNHFLFKRGVSYASRGPDAQA